MANHRAIQTTSFDPRKQCDLVVASPGPRLLLPDLCSNQPTVHLQSAPSRPMCRSRRLESSTFDSSYDRSAYGYLRLLSSLRFAKVRYVGRRMHPSPNRQRPKGQPFVNTVSYRQAPPRCEQAPRYGGCDVRWRTAWDLVRNE